jgi:hypothetical protein
MIDPAHKIRLLNLHNVDDRNSCVSNTAAPDDVIMALTLKARLERRPVLGDILSSKA